MRGPHRLRELPAVPERNSEVVCRPPLATRSPANTYNFKACASISRVSLLAHGLQIPLAVIARSAS